MKLLERKSNASKTPFLIGRMMFGGYFLYNGINHFVHERELAEYAAHKHVPKPDAAVRVSGALLAIGGTSLLLGLKPKLGAAAVIGFLAAVSPTINNFWAEDDPQTRQNQTVHFAKNLALLGGALALAAVEEPWPASIHKKRTLFGKAKKTAWKVLAA